MFGSLSNLVFLLIPLAIFIGRMVVEARNRKQPAKKAPPRIPVHFEDDEPKYFRTKASTGTSTADPSVKGPGKARHQSKETLASSLQGAAISPNDGIVSAPLTDPNTPAIKESTTGVASTNQSNFAFYLNRLPPLKQAVVMAEVLGPPKAVQ